VSIALIIITKVEIPSAPSSSYYDFWTITTIITVSTWYKVSHFHNKEAIHRTLSNSHHFDSSYGCSN